MLSFQFLIILCWAIFLFYWVINWKSVKPTKEVTLRQRSFFGVLLWVVVLVIILRLSIPSLDIQHLFKPISAPFFTLQLAGVIFSIIGLVIAITARKTLADNWSADVEFKKNHTLITTGIYHYVRHPIYTGITFMGIGTSLALQSIYSILFYTVMIAFFIYKFRQEEKLLLKHFSKEYPEYMKRTKALIPFIY